MDGFGSAQETSKDRGARTILTPVHQRHVSQNLCLLLDDRSPRPVFPGEVSLSWALCDALSVAPGLLHPAAVARLQTELLASTATTTTTTGTVEALGLVAQCLLWGDDTRTAFLQTLQLPCSLAGLLARHIDLPHVFAAVSACLESGLDSSADAATAKWSLALLGVLARAAADEAHAWKGERRQQGVLENTAAIFVPLCHNPDKAQLLEGHALEQLVRLCEAAFAAPISTSDTRICLELGAALLFADSDIQQMQPQQEHQVTSGFVQSLFDWAVALLCKPLDRVSAGAAVSALEALRTAVWWASNHEMEYSVDCVWSVVVGVMTKAGYSGLGQEAAKSALVILDSIPTSRERQTLLAALSTRELDLLNQNSRNDVSSPEKDSKWTELAKDIK